MQFFRVRVIVWVLSLASVATAHAGTYIWSVSSGTGAWSASTNWSPAGPPTSADTAFVENGGTAAISQSGAACYTLALWGQWNRCCADDRRQPRRGRRRVYRRHQVRDVRPIRWNERIDSGLASWLLFHLFGQLLPEQFRACCTRQTSTWARRAPWAFNQTGGTNAASCLYLKQRARSGHIHPERGGFLSASGTEAVGYASSGTLNQTGGTNATNWLSVGNAAAAPGVYTLVRRACSPRPTVRSTWAMPAAGCSTSRAARTPSAPST